MVLMPLTPRFKQASLSFSIGVDIVGTIASEIGSRHNGRAYTPAYTK